jgi:hypothetical protein
MEELKAYLKRAHEQGLGWKTVESDFKRHVREMRRKPHLEMTDEEWALFCAWAEGYFSGFTDGLEACGEAVV